MERHGASLPPPLLSHVHHHETGIYTDACVGSFSERRERLSFVIYTSVVRVFLFTLQIEGGDRSSVNVN